MSTHSFKSVDEVPVTFSAETDKETVTDIESTSSTTLLPECQAFDYRKYATATDFEIKKVILYFILAYLYTWTIWFSLLGITLLFPNINIWFLFPFGLIGAAGPLFSSCTLTYKYEGGFTALKKFLKRGLQFKSIPFWIYYTILLSYILPKFITGFFIDGTEIDYMGLATFVPMFLVMYFGGPLQEEYGWRGYALDRIQLKYNSLLSSLIIGVIWGFWHFPLFCIEMDPHSNMNLWYFVLENIGSSVIITWLYNQSGSNITVALLCHMANNSTGDIFTLDDEIDKVARYSCVIQLIFALLIIVPIFGFKTFTQNRS